MCEYAEIAWKKKKPTVLRERKHLKQTLCKYKDTNYVKTKEMIIIVFYKAKATDVCGNYRALNMALRLLIDKVMLYGLV